jgi:hypothetical protein
MIGEKSGKVLRDSAIHSTHNVKSKEPLVERVKRRVKRAAKYAGLGLKIGLAELLAMAPVVTAQEIASNFSKPAETEQTAADKIITSTCGATLNYINNNMQKLTDQNDIDLANSIFNKIKSNDGKTDGKIVKGTIQDVTFTQPAQKYFMDYLKIDEDEFQKLAKDGMVRYDIAYMDEKGVNLQVHIQTIKGSKVVGTKNGQTEITMSFRNKDNTRTYISELSCPEGCEVSSIIPFFVGKEDNIIKFGVCYKYTQNGIENEMVSCIFYDTVKGSAITAYFKKDNYKELFGIGVEFST